MRNLIIKFGTIFDDKSDKPIASGAPPYTDTFSPDSPLSDFRGFDGNGTWTLHAADYKLGYVGNLNAWSLMVTDQ